MNKSLMSAIAAVSLLGSSALADGHGHKMPGSPSMEGEMHGKEIMVKSPWARASIGKNGAAFVTVVNGGKTDDKLVGVLSDIAKRTELHTHKMEGNIMRMRPVENIPVPAGGTVTLKPGGHHVMFMGLKQKLSEGGEFPLTLIFEKAGKMRVSVKIGKMGAMGAMGATGTKGGMPDHGSQGGYKMKP